MRKTAFIITAILVLCFTSCGNTKESSSSESLADAGGNTSSGAALLADSQQEEMPSVEKSPSEIYEEAMQKIEAGSSLEGIKMLADIPSYKDSEKYLEAYTGFEYYIGEWVADLESDFEKGITAYPYEMSFTISDAGIWFDSEINGYQRLRFPVKVQYTIWIDNQTEAGEKDYQGYLLFETKNGKLVAEDCILFGVEEGGLWYNFHEKTDTSAWCEFSVSDASGTIDTKANNNFYCERTTEKQEADITWEKESGAKESSQSTEKTPAEIHTAPAGNDQALSLALAYLSVSAFSRQGLIEQLEFEGISHSEAVSAADSCGADWKEQALLKALEYLDVSAFSRSGLQEQLKFEGFTDAEAKYGADNCGADWNAQAAKKARQYLEYSTFTKSDLIDQLIFEGFTQSQAEYGAGKAF